MWWLLSHVCTCRSRGKDAHLLPEKGIGVGVDFCLAGARNGGRALEDAVNAS